MKPLTMVIAPLLAALCLGLLPCRAYGQERRLYNMDQIRDDSLLELQVLQDWHLVSTTPPTQQKIVEITQCRFGNGRAVRIPVTYVVPVTEQACHFIVSYGNLGPTVYKEFDGLMTKMLENNIGFVLPAIGPINKMKPDGPQIDAEMKQLFRETGEIKYITPWFWGATYMRAITAALTEKERFRSDKIACDGRSKSAIASAIALIHYPGVTGLYGRVIPSSSFPEYFNKQYQEEVEADNRDFYRQLAAGEITRLGTIDDDAYAEMRERAKRFVRTGNFPTYSRRGAYNEDVLKMCVLTENLDLLKTKNAEYHLFVGTNDNVTMDVPRLAQQYPDYPITYYPRGRHGGRSRFIGISGTPDTEEAKANRIAFFSEFYLGQNALLEKPGIQYQYQPQDRTLSVTVSFHEDTPKNVALHYAYDRFAAGSVGYEYDVWQQHPMEQTGQHSWTLNMVVPDHVKTVSMLSFQQGEKKAMTSYSSSNYCTVKTNKVDQ